MGRASAITVVAVAGTYNRRTYITGRGADSAAVSGKSYELRCAIAFHDGGNAVVQKSK